MVNKFKTKIRQNMKSRTQYITIPVIMVTDSQYPFEGDEIIEVEIISKEEGLIIKKIKK